MPRNTFHPVLVIITIAAITLSVISLAPSPAQLVEGEVNTTRNEALVLAKKGQTDQAMRKLKLLSKNYPNEPEILIDQLTILHSAGRTAELLDLFASIELQYASKHTIDMLIDAAADNGGGYKLLYGASLDILPVNPYLAEQLVAHLISNKPAMAKDLLVEALNIAPNNRQLQLLAAKTFASNNRNMLSIQSPPSNSNATPA